MSHKAVSFRALIAGEVMDFLAAAGMGCADTQQAVVELVSALSNYEEEGASLKPRVILCDDVGVAAATLGESEVVKIGAGPLAADTVQVALKRCAPLASRRWYIFLERCGQTLKYGLLSPSQDPLSVGPGDMLTVGSDSDLPVVLVEQTSLSVVELRDGRGSSIEFSFSGVQVGTSQDHSNLMDLAEAATASVADADRDSTRAYLARCIAEALSAAHGALIAVLPTGNCNLPGELLDAVVLESPIDVTERVRVHAQDRSRQTMGSLETLSDLITGMLCSDGILVVSSDAQILAYRAFVKSDADASSAGGARSRAYSALRSLVGNGQLRAAFFRSQDGRSSCCGVDDGK